MSHAMDLIQEVQGRIAIGVEENPREKNPPKRTMSSNLYHLGHFGPSKPGKGKSNAKLVQLFMMATAFTGNIFGSLFCHSCRRDSV